MAKNETPGTPAPAARKERKTDGPRYTSYTVDGTKFATEPEAIVAAYNAMKAGKSPIILGVAARGSGIQLLSLSLIPARG